MRSPVVPLPERVVGPRLVLRRWACDDLELQATVVGRNLEHLRPWMPWVADEPLSTGARIELLERWEREWAGGGDMIMAILLGDEVVGSIGLHRRRGPHGIEIGYWVDKDHLRRGIATEAAAMMTTMALSLPGVSFVEIHHDKANVRSGMVPRRLGYEFLGECADGARAPAAIGIDWIWRMTDEKYSTAQGPEDRASVTRPIPGCGRSADVH